MLINKVLWNETPPPSRVDTICRCRQWWRKTKFATGINNSLLIWVSTSSYCLSNHLRDFALAILSSLDYSGLCHAKSLDKMLYCNTKLHPSSTHLQSGITTVHIPTSSATFAVEATNIWMFQSLGNGEVSHLYAITYFGMIYAQIIKSVLRS